MTITTTPAEVRPARRVARTVLPWLLVLPGLIWAVVRQFGWETGVLVQVIPFTPYAAAWSLIPLLVALLTRKWLAAAAAAVAVAMLAVAVLPRALPDRDRGPRDGVPLTVMTANMYLGDADPADVVRMVREHDVAVLAVQEFTPGAKDRLAAAGLGNLLPYEALADEPGATGSGLYSRYPMTGQGSRRGHGDNLQEGNQQVYATIQPPGARPVNVESAHPLAPYQLPSLASWRADLEEEPRPDPKGNPQILLGDFNSTLDHAPVRTLVRSGYRDAADALGQGLRPTWGPWGARPVPPITLDHVLADRRIGIQDFDVYPVRDSDHRALVATLTVPAA